MKQINKIFLAASVMSAIILLAGIIMQQPVLYRSFALLTAICFAIGLGAIENLKGYRYTAWIIVAVVAGMMFPAAFTKWGSFDLRNKWMILIVVQVVMFGMGIQMSLKDFSGLAQTGKGVAIGLLCHFSIMPLMGLLLTKIFHFEPEIAAGIILIGSCSHPFTIHYSPLTNTSKYLSLPTCPPLKFTSIPFIFSFFEIALHNGAPATNGAIISTASISITLAA